MEAWTIWLAFGTALLTFAVAVTVTVVLVWRGVRRIVWTIDRLDQVLDTELVNGADVTADGYKGFREEVMERFAEGGVWMRTHERLPTEMAHGVRREPPG